MATNNSVNLKNSGIVSYDGAGTFSALANPLIVANGGTGAASETAYAVLCGGTTSTAAVQSIAGIGSSGQVLTSNGAGALPTFQAASGGLGYVFNIHTSDSPSASTTYYLSTEGFSWNTSALASYRFYIPHSGTITKVYGEMGVVGTNASGDSTLALRLNGTTDTNITTTLKFDTNNNPFSNTGLSIAVSAGDYFLVKLVTPAWSPSPTNCHLVMSVYVS